MRKKLNLHDKLLLVAKNVRDPKRRGTNQDYAWTRAEDVSLAFRTMLWKSGILFTACDLEHTTERFEDERIVTVKTEFIFSDGQEEIRRVGFGSGTGEKGLYQAQTGAVKYIFLRLGLITNTADDPDEASSGSTAAKRRDPKRIKLKDVMAFQDACVAGGKTAQQVADYLKSEWDVATATDMPRSGAQDAIKWANGTQSFEEQAKASLAVLEMKKSESTQ
jgi:hypothetical protein